MPTYSPKAGILAALLSVVVPVALHAQVPTKCLEIERILVDACIEGCPGAEEGANEMVRFVVGPMAINIADLVVQWPNNSFRGFVQNAQTLTVTETLNAGIHTCGRLIQPPMGDIPAGAKVVMVTSAAMCAAANSFNGLQEDVYIIYQAAGNTQGHFANHNNGMDVRATPVAGTTTRTLRMLHTLTACGDTVSYVRENLVNSYGTYGGSIAENDGAYVDFSWPGRPTLTYGNNGCQAPVEVFTAEVITPGAELACGATISLEGIAVGATSVIWSGGTGSFNDPASATPVYTPGGGDAGGFTLRFCGIDACGGQVCDSVAFTLAGGGPNVQVNGDHFLCSQFDTAIMNATGADTYVWSNGGVGNRTVFDLMASGTNRWVVGTNACGSDTAFFDVTMFSVTGYYGSTSCFGYSDGNSSVFARGGLEPYTYLWENGETTDTIHNQPAGRYNVRVEDANGCVRTMSVPVVEPPLLTVTVQNDTTICAGSRLILVGFPRGGSPGWTFHWSDPNTIVYPTETTEYSLYVTDRNGCTSDTVSFTATIAPAAPADVTLTGPTGCGPWCVTLVTTTAGTATWDLGDGTTLTGDSITYCYTAAGSYTPRLSVDTGGGCAAIWSAAAPLDLSNSASVADVTVTGPTGCGPWCVDLTTTTAGTATWDLGDGTTLTGSSITHCYTVAGNYQPRLAVDLGDGCTASWSAAAPFDLQVAPEAVVSLGAITGCGPWCIDLSTTTTGNSYTWDLGDGSTASGTSLNHCYVQPGSYQPHLSIDLGGGCTAEWQAATPIVIVPGPLAQINADPLEGTAPLVVQFTNTSTPSTEAMWWDFGDGGTSIIVEPLYVFNDPGVFTVVLTVGVDCADRDSLTIIVRAEATVDSSWIHVPNVFTPNGDGKNDVFRLGSNNLERLEVAIYNRWGQQVGRIFQANGYWDGRTEAGELCPEGTYFVTVIARGRDGVDHELRTALTLLR